MRKRLAASSLLSLELCLVIVAALPSCCPVLAQGQASKVFGIDFSPYVDGQNPNLGSQITPAQITARLQIIAPYTQWIRTFSSTHGLENVPLIARQFGLKVAANAWISRDMTQNVLEINNLIANSNAGLVDIAVVGSESILRNDVTESQLLAYMDQVRQAIPAGVPVTTADVWGTFVAHPGLIAASDIVFANFYPYWEGTSVENAACSLVQEYQELVAASGSRPVAVSETGWPSAGNAVGAAVPSVAAANLYALRYLTWAEANNIQSFYFEAFDEVWKIASEGPQGAHWGIWDNNGLVKPGMDGFFSGQRAAVSCDGTIPGPVEVQFTYVPPYGSGDLLEVQVTGVRPSAYVLATYIKVGGGWWTKPTFAQPTVAINQDGTARIRIVTGGSDQLATDIAVCMVPVGSIPPEARGGALPAVPDAVGLCPQQVSRTQSSISGVITDGQNNPIQGAMVSSPVLGWTTSAPDGKYSFYNITATGTVTLTVTHPGYSFPQETVTISTGNLVVNFMGTLLAPGIPGAVFPVDGSVEVSTVLTLSWTGGTGATSFDVYFGDLPSPPFVTNKTETTYNPGTLSFGKTYFWRIVAKNSSGSTSSATWSFVTTAGGTADTIVSPIPGSSLSDSPVMFCWTNSRNYVHWLDVGTAPGIGDLYGWAQPAGSTCKTITDPGATLGNGGTVYVTVRSLINNVWNPAPGSTPGPGTSATYTAPLHTFWPLGGTVFTSSSVVFSWAPVPGATMYWLDVGPGQGNGSIFGGFVTGTSQLVTNITPAGGAIWARLWVYKDGALQQPTDYQYTACNHCVATINSPPVIPGFIPGSIVGTLPGSTAQFCWDSSTGADAYFLDVGTIPGQGNIYGVNQGPGTCQIVSGMPATGIVHVQVTTHRDGDWKRPAMQYRYLGADSTAKITSPTPGTTLPSSTVTFCWTPVAGADHYWLDVGTVRGQGTIYAGDQGLATCRTITGIPNGTIWVRLWTFYGGIMVPVDFEYTR